MRNHFFQFKKFTVHQRKSGMKVCTDSCLFGAWIANKIEKGIIEPQTVLDIGSGTGLLSLMIAQKSDAEIHAVELEPDSFSQNQENFVESPYGSRLQAFNSDIKIWSGHLKYDLIISNPPFFENDLKGNHHNQNLAKHNTGLTLTDMLEAIKKNLAKNGFFGVLLPYHRADYFKKNATENGFYLKEELLVKQTPKHDFFRSLLFFDSQPCKGISTELTIKEDSGHYSAEFVQFLKDYYLAL